MWVKKGRLVDRKREMKKERKRDEVKEREILCVIGLSNDFWVLIPNI